MLYIAYAVLWLLRFALGACVFSFLGVVVWRLPRRESVVKGRSHCPVCGRTLSAAELLPCLSYLLQGGKCRGCGAKIPARDFWIEVLGGLCSCACAYAFGGETAQAALAFCSAAASARCCSPKRRQTGKASSHSVRFCASALRSPCFSEKRSRTGIWDYCNEWRGGSAWLHPTTTG